jgi:hypothetical protein
MAELVSDLDEWEATYQLGETVAWTKAGLGVRKKGQLPDPNKRYLINKQEELGDSVSAAPFVAPSSLREVEAEIHVYLLNQHLPESLEEGISE